MLVEVAGIEPATPNGLHLSDIFRYRLNAILANGTVSVNL